MSFAVNVQGGTGAGIKRPLRDPHPDWPCPSCKKTQPGYATRCLTGRCNERRPR